MVLAQVIDPSSEDSNLDAANNGKSAAALVDENSTTSFTEDSLDKPLTPAPSTPAPLTPALAAEPDSTSNGAGEETNDSIATSDSATNDSTIANVITASISQESAEGDGEESRSSVGEVKEAEKRKQEDEETQIAKKAKTGDEVEPDTQQKEEEEK